MTTPPNDTTSTPDQAREVLDAELASLRHLIRVLAEVDRALGLARPSCTPETGTPPAPPDTLQP